MFCSKYDADKNFSYMDGIPVKISEQYKPPKKISVPSGVLNRQKMEVEEYDFRLEKSMIKKMDEWRELRKISAERRRQRLEMEDQCGNGESKNVGVTEAISRLTMQSPEPNRIQQIQQSPQSSVTVPVSQQELPQSTSYHIKGGESGSQGVHSHSDPILTPVPVTSHNPYNHQTILKKSFNISDFESDTSSPFDNMELKTLNDIEELAHVLQPNLNSNNCDISCPSSSQPPQQQDVSLRLTTQLTSNESSLSSSSVSKKTDDPFTTRINGMNSLHYSNYNILNSSHLWPQYNLLHYHSNHSHNHNHYNYLGAHNTWAQSILPDSYNPNIQSYVVQRLDHLETDHQPQQQSHLPPHNQPMTTTVVAGTASKSVPDIIQELALELKDKRALEKERTKKTVSHPTRPASIGPTEDELEKRSSLSNPLNQLTPSCQQLTLRLTEMGFPLPRVARAVQRFGDNETKVLEFLLQVQHLEEGGCPPDRAEMALVVNKCNLSETIKYLETLKQLLDLGFVEKKVIEALEEHSNDRDKALESLIS